MSGRIAYSRLQIALHWAIAALIFACYFTADGMGRALRQRIEAGQTGIEGNTLHVWLGGSAVLLIVLRLILRASAGAPGPLPGTSDLAAKANVWGHRLLYALMIAAPIPGFVAWYGGVTSVGEAHELLGNALVLIGTAHALIAILHHVVLKDATLTRMIPALARPKG